MTWCQILDVEEFESTDKVHAFHWNSYADQEGLASVPGYLERHADRLRSRLLALLHDLGAVRVGGRSVVEHLEVKDGFSLWWMSLLVEKDLQKSTRLFDCLRLLALEEMLRIKKPCGIDLVSNDKVLASAIKNLCAGLGIPSRWQRLPGSVGDRPQSVVQRLHRLLPRPLQAALWLARYVVERWSLRCVRSGLSSQGSGDITVFSYFLHLDPQSCPNGCFYSRQWGAVGELLNTRGAGVNWFHHFLKSSDVPDAHTGRVWLERFNLDPVRQGRHQFMDSFLNVGIVVRVFRNILASSVVAWRCRKVEHELSASGLPTWLWPLVREDFRESVCGRTAARNLLWIELFDAAIGVLPRQRLGLYLYENQGWEQAMIHAWRKYGHGDLIAVAHATVRFWDLRYFKDPRVFCDKTRLALPLPDKLAVNGTTARSALLAAGFPEERFVEVEAQRYLGLAALVAKRAFDSKAPSQGQKRVLVLGDIMQAATDGMMRLLQGLPVDLGKRFDFTVKPHPGCPIFPADYPPLIYQVTHEPLNRILCEYDIAYAANATSAALDAFLAGVRVVVHQAAGQINLSPLRGMRGVKFVSTVEELGSVFRDEWGVDLNDLGDDFFWLDQSLPRWRAVISQQSSAL